jgi:hypothetical protein
VDSSLIDRVSKGRIIVAIVQRKKPCFDECPMAVIGAQNPSAFDANQRDRF